MTSAATTTSSPLATDHHGDFEKQGRRHFGRIVVRDSLGMPLDTMTSYQQAIYEARWRLSCGEPPAGPEEWRLPHAPCPARPDLTRAAPPSALQRMVKAEERRRKRVSHSLPDIGEALESEREYQDLRWSLQQAETLPALVGADILQQGSDRLARRTYLPFVGSAPVVNRPLSGVERREGARPFPGLCSGCQKGLGLCYGCQRNPNPHYHFDKMARTGGGFTYYRHDRPVDEILANNPSMWGVSAGGSQGVLPGGDRAASGGGEGRWRSLSQRAELTTFSGPYSYVYYDNLKYPDLKKYGMKVKVTPLPDASERGLLLGLGDYIDQDEDEDADTAERSTESGLRHHYGYAMQTPASDIVSGMDTPSSRDSMPYIKVDLARFPSSFSADQIRAFLPPVSEHVSEQEAEDEKDRQQTEQEVETAVVDSPEGGAAGGGDTGAPSEQSKRPKLYKAPKAFKLKSMERKVTEARDPFSTDRSYDINKGSGIDIKKSDKPPTEFIQVARGDDSWQAPPKFEPQMGEQNTTTFVPPVAPKKELSRSRSDGHDVTRVPPPTRSTTEIPSKKKAVMVPVADSTTKRTTAAKPVSEGSHQTTVDKCALLDGSYCQFTDQSDCDCHYGEGSPKGEDVPSGSHRYGSPRLQGDPPVSHRYGAPGGPSNLSGLKNADFSLTKELSLARDLQWARSLGVVGDPCGPRGGFLASSYPTCEGDMIHPESAGSGRRGGAWLAPIVVSSVPIHARPWAERDGPPPSLVLQPGLAAAGRVVQGGRTVCLPKRCEVLGCRSGDAPAKRDSTSVLLNRLKSNPAFSDRKSNLAIPDRKSQRVFPNRKSNPVFPDRKSNQFFTDRMSQPTFSDRKLSPVLADRESVWYDPGQDGTGFPDDSGSRSSDFHNAPGLHVPDLPGVPVTVAPPEPGTTRRGSPSAGRGHHGVDHEGESQSSENGNSLESQGQSSENGNSRESQGQSSSEGQSLLVWFVGDGTSGDDTSGDGTSAGGTSGDGASGDGASGDGTFSTGTSADGVSNNGSKALRPTPEQDDATSVKHENYIHATWRPLVIPRLPGLRREQENSRRDSVNGLSGLHRPPRERNPRQYSVTSEGKSASLPEIIILPLRSREAATVSGSKEIVKKQREHPHSRRSSEFYSLSKKSYSGPPESSPDPPVEGSTPIAMTPTPVTPSPLPQSEEEVTAEEPPAEVPPPEAVEEKKPRPPVMKKERKPREAPVKKTRREPERKERSKIETPPPPPREDTPRPSPQTTPEPEIELPEYREPSLPTPPPMRKVDPPPLPRAAPPVPPMLQEYPEPEKPRREVSRTLVEAPPPMLEPPRQRKLPPAFVSKPKPRPRRGPVRRSEVLAPKTEAKDMSDPLDYLAKYCIIHPERLPHYERVFYKVVEDQLYRYVDVPHEDATSVTSDPAQGQGQGDDEVAAPPAHGEVPVGRPVKTKLTQEEERLIRGFTAVDRTATEEFHTVGCNQGDQMVSKLTYTLDSLIDKYEVLQESFDKLQADRVRVLADQARKLFPEVLSPHYKPEKKKKKGKKSKKSQKKSGLGGDVMFQLGGGETGDSQADPTPPSGHRHLTDMDVLGRLSDKMVDTVMKVPEVTHMTLEIERLQERLRDVDDRIEDLEDEKRLLHLYSRDQFISQQTARAKPETFQRKQSALYQRMHPPKDPEMNLSELAEALQQINGHLITDKEMEFIFYILDLPGRQRINVQLFSVIAALSEKVKQVDPFIRKLINKFDFKALSVKMDRAKEMFFLLDEQDSDIPSGKINARTLALELAAGGVSPEHTQYVVSKFNREKKGIVDMLDFFTYVPLFIEIHGRIIDDPFNEERPW